MSKLRFGFSCYPYSRFADLDAIIATNQLLEKLGFHYSQIGEHLIVPQENAGTLDDLWYDTAALAGTLFAKTERLHILFGVVVVPYRHPVELAKRVATLDLLSKGRLIVGAGVGWAQREFELLGIPFHERGAITDDYLRACKALWASETPSYQGRYVSFDDVVFKPRPYSQPHPPIWIGGAAEQTIARAVELGDGLHPLGGPLSRLEQMAKTTRELLEQKGRDPAKFTFTLTADYGATVSHHAKQAGGQDLTLIIGPEMDRALEQVDQFARAGFSCVTIRTPARDLGAIHDLLHRFHEEVMKPSGCA